MILSDYELACLYSANGDNSKVDKIDADVTQKLLDMNLIVRDDTRADPPYVITDAGKHFLDAHANNRGIV